MPDARSLSIQSVLYLNHAPSIVRAAEAVVASAMVARESNVLGEWSLVLGDCGDPATLSAGDVVYISKAVSAGGGTLVHREFGANLGHGGGHNRLVPESTSDLILFLNPDAVLAPDTVLKLMSASRDGVGLVDGRQLPLEHPKIFDRSTGETSWASGACAITSRAAFGEIGGFDDTTFFLYCDDVDLSWRMKLAGRSVLHEPAARVFHDKRLTITGDIEPGEAEAYYSAEAALLLAHKYSRPDLVREILTSHRQSQDDARLRAAAEYARRSSSGLLPDPLDADHQVAQFVNGNYAIHRY